MDPDVTSASPGTCPRCGMTLVATGPDGLPAYRVELTTDPNPPRPGEPLELRFAIVHPVTAKRERNLQLVHEKPFHLFVVSDDLAFYAHLHPEEQDDGTWAVTTRLPRKARYSLFCDFLPAGARPQVVRLRVATAGVRPRAMPQREVLQPDAVLDRVVDGIRFQVAMDPPTPVPGRLTTLRYHLTDAATGSPIVDLEPYLAAWGHTLILSDDSSEYVHSHPAMTVNPGRSGGESRGGPDVEFGAHIGKPGIHRVWSQFKRQGRVTTVAFTFDVAIPRYLVRWDGVRWSTLDGKGRADLDGPVRALATRGRDVFVGGQFKRAGDVAAASIARWDGKRWHSMGGGCDGPVRAIAGWGRDLYVAGEFTRAGGVDSPGIARWDGKRWWPLGAGLTGSGAASAPVAVNALAVRGDRIIAAGRFRTAGSVPAASIASWDGSRWEPLGDGVANGIDDGIVWALAARGADLIAAGEFQSAGGVPAGNVALWDGSHWRALGSGVSGGVARVTSLAATADSLVVGGEFTRAGDAPASRVASWDGTSWRPIGAGTIEAVTALAFEGGLYAGSARGIARWDGSRWSSLGGGLAAEVFCTPVLVVLAETGAVYAGGGPFVLR